MSAGPAALLLALGACASSPPPRPAAAPPATAPAAIGETFTFDSRVLGERRVINVYLPPDYATSGARYPVLYMPDGGLKEDFPHVAGAVDVSIKNAVIRPVIVVGVENTDRRHDLTAVTRTPEEQEAAPRAGGSATFRTFFRDELKPHIAAHYRTTGESGLIGESLAGHFVVETFLEEPALFDSYIAADPSLQWNGQALARRANALIEDLAAPKQLYLANADEPVIQAGVDVLLASLRILAPRGLRWTYEPMPAEHHHTIFPFAALRGIRTVFAP
ncbi:MAG: alpha/beta hydrolase [Myxococcales bacterium]|nr:alpha/beta hydrolase [Myxococcales bacterium]